MIDDILKELETSLTDLRKAGITLSKPEREQLARALGADIKEEPREEQLGIIDQIGKFFDNLDLSSIIPMVMSLL
jgi:hypothetical protein